MDTPTFSVIDINANSRKRRLWKAVSGVTVGFITSTASRRREKRPYQPLPSRIVIWTTGTGVSPSFRSQQQRQAYRNNLQLLNLEQQNLVTAKRRQSLKISPWTVIYRETFPVLKYARHKRVCWMPRERILSAKYTQTCEISLLQIHGKST